MVRSNIIKNSYKISLRKMRQMTELTLMLHKFPKKLSMKNAKVIIHRI